MPKAIRDEALRKEVKAFVEKVGTQVEAAKRLGFHPSSIFRFSKTGSATEANKAKLRARLKTQHATLDVAFKTEVADTERERLRQICYSVLRLLDENERLMQSVTGSR